MDQWLVPHAALAVFALMMAIVSFWVKRSPWIWGSFLLLSFALGYFAKLITPIALVPIGALLILHALLTSDIRGLLRFILFAVTVVLSLGLIINYFPGFHEWTILEKTQISPDALPFSLRFGFAKPFIGFFVLAWSIPLVKNIKEFERVIKVALPLTVGGIAIMILLSLFSGLIHWDPKFPTIFWFFAINNLILVSVIEEAFWRGFFQRELFRWFGGRSLLAGSGAVVLTSLAFAALHWWWAPSIPFLGLVFVASLIYGSIYQITKAIEASIFCHWLFNLTHFLFFTYPVLQNAT
ncbi:MAG: hypothetical protein KR126chlam1_01178 [Chlamydiae bacterium]|nr:hypothetical protein [Chlamydiota bacterium]